MVLKDNGYKLTSYIKPRYTLYIAFKGKMYDNVRCFKHVVIL